MNTHTASTLNLAPASTANPDHVQPAGNAPPGPAPNPQVQVGRRGAAPGGGGRPGGGRGVGGVGGGGNTPYHPPGPRIGKNPPNVINFSLITGGSNLGVLD